MVTGTPARRRPWIGWTAVPVSALAIVGFVLATYTQGILETMAKTGAGVTEVYVNTPVVVQATNAEAITTARTSSTSPRRRRSG